MSERVVWVDGEKVVWREGTPPPIALWGNHAPYELVVRAGEPWLVKMGFPPEGTNGAEGGALIGTLLADMVVGAFALRNGVYPPSTIREPLTRIWIGPCDEAGRPRGEGSGWWGVTVAPASRPAVALGHRP
jgi:hypothetical protein